MTDTEIDLLLSMTALLAPLDEEAQRRVMALFDEKAGRPAAMTARCESLELERASALDVFRELEKRFAAAGFKPGDHLRQLVLDAIRALSRLPHSKGGTVA